MNTKSTLRQSPVVLMPSGDLTVAALQAALVPIEVELRRGQRALLVDVRRVETLRPDARDYFVRWSKLHRSELSAMAIVTEKKAWRALVTALSFVTSGPLRAFREPIAATAWLNGAG